MQRKYISLLSLAGSILCLDQLTKSLAGGLLDKKKTIIPHLLDFQLIKSSGFAFGWFARNPASLDDYVNWTIPVLALFLIVLIFVKLQDNQFIISIALTLILSGAVSNLVDRLQYGAVIDFICFHLGGMQLPPLNVADMTILVGSALVILRTLRRSHEKNRSDRILSS